ncbi:MAG TPA: T9SS type A sorting domain-containing protein [Candidatus Nitrosotenuis sp.]|nr:T9SS type A sorting domain-containing protein [Candidatus Nitrosotenuis sp.]
MRTDGTVLLHVDSANGPYCIGSCLGLTDAFVPIRNTSDGAKLFLQSGKNVGRQEILIYSLCGELPVEIFDFRQFQQAIVNIYPNPTMGLVTFQVSLLDNMQEYDLIISDSNAKEIKRKKINVLDNKYVINVADYSSGAYYYSLSLKNKVLKSGKFILTK